MVAGALILTFFTTIAQKQYNISVQKSEYQLVNNLETLFSVALKTPNTLNELKISSPIEFSCTEYGCKYKIENSELSFYNKLIFSAQKQEGDLKLWTLDFEKPFRVATMLFISSSETKYYLVYQGDIEDEDNKPLKRIPSGINIELITENEARNKQHSGEQYTRFVYYKTNKGDVHESFRDKNFDSVELDLGAVSFYDKEGRMESSYYSQDDASIFAAIFSANKEMYEYQMKRMFKRLIEVSEVYKQRTDFMTNSECVYDSNKLQDIISVANTQDLSQFSSLNTKSSNLKNENDRIITQGCPEIY